MSYVFERQKAIEKFLSERGLSLKVMYTLAYVCYIFAGTTTKANDSAVSALSSRNTNIYIYLYIYIYYHQTNI